jgi:FlaA1/EpsC-like NDP-sugar epimerase
MLTLRTRVIAWMVIDALILAGSLAVAYQLAFEFEPLPEYIRQFQAVLLPVIAVELALLLSFGLYRRMLRFAGLGELLIVASALTLALLAGLLYFLLQRSAGNTPADPGVPPWQWPIPRSVLGINWLLGMGAVGGVRLVRRLGQAWPTGRPSKARRALVIGATDVGDFAVRMLHRSPGVGLRAVAFLDDSGAFEGRTIQGLPIAGSLPDLGEVLSDWQIDEVLIALPEAGPTKITRIVEQCRRHSVGVRVLPSQNELIAGQRALGSLRSVDVAELLGREPADLHLDDSLNYVQGEVVVITGAGGSIGSEICRQVANLEPAAMVMIGRGENSLFELSQELESRLRQRPGSRTGPRHYVVADVRESSKMKQVFAEHRPGVIFHAAAHKHVPLMEAAPDEAVKNNVLATDLLAGLAHEHGTKRFVMISTDKAVRPSSVMGASKRIAEQVISAWAAKSPVRFVSVRFGNVLGSRGSVIPIFRRQIERGGPLTVTHPEAERYFMTVEEATSLVLRAGAVAESGQLCVLDMGEPVRIEDLARNLITLSGLEPGRDIEIEFTGLRPGEKLLEEYLSSREGLEKTAIGKVWVTRPEVPEPEQLARDLETLREAARRGEGAEITRILASRIPDYNPAQVANRI